MGSVSRCIIQQYVFLAVQQALNIHLKLAHRRPAGMTGRNRIVTVPGCFVLKPANQWRPAFVTNGTTSQPHFL